MMNSEVGEGQLRKDYFNAVKRNAESLVNAPNLRHLKEAVVAMNKYLEERERTSPVGHTESAASGKTLGYMRAVYRRAGDYLNTGTEGYRPSLVEAGELLCGVVLAQKKDELEDARDAALDSKSNSGILDALRAGFANDRGAGTTGTMFSSDEVMIRETLVSVKDLPRLIISGYGELAYARNKTVIDAERGLNEARENVQNTMKFIGDIHIDRPAGEVSTSTT